MAKKYEVDGKYFLPVTVFTTDARSINPVGVQYVYASNGSKGATYLDDYPDLLLTAEEIYASRQMADKIEHMGEMLDYGRKKYDEIEELKVRIAELEKENGEWKDAVDEKIVDVQHITEESTELKADYDELKTRNAELEALLKEVMATRDEAIKQNNELIAENEKLRAENEEWQKTARCYSENAYSDLELTRKLRAENEKLKTELDQRNKDFWAMKKDRDELDCIGGKLRAQNEKLKAERDDLKSQVGKNLADIQGFNAEIHFFKEERDKQKAEYDELKDRYDELDSVNKEQAEKIRKLDKRNKYLESEKNRKPIVHVLTNDGHVYAFTSSGKVSVKYHTELNILMIEDGEKAIAGFSRGDKPGNLSAWWTG